MNNSAINKAQETLEYLSQDPVARAKYEARLKYLSDYNTSMYTERQEGREEAKIQVAKKMRELGFSPDIVMKITGLTIEELEKL